MSWSTDMSPTASFVRQAAPAHRTACTAGPAGGVPGVGMTGGYWEGVLGGLYRYPPVPSQDPYLVYFQTEAYPRPNEANFKVLMRFLRLGLDKGPI